MQPGVLWFAKTLAVAQLMACGPQDHHAAHGHPPHHTASTALASRPRCCYGPAFDALPREMHHSWSEIPEQHRHRPPAGVLPQYAWFNIIFDLTVDKGSVICCVFRWQHTGSLLSKAPARYYRQEKKKQPLHRCILQQSSNGRSCHKIFRSFTATACRHLSLGHHLYIPSWAWGLGCISYSYGEHTHAFCTCHQSKEKNLLSSVKRQHGHRCFWILPSLCLCRGAQVTFAPFVKTLPEIRCPPTL